MRWLVVLIAGCPHPSTPQTAASPSSEPEDFRCPDGTVLTVEAPGTGTHRTLPDTEVQACLGPDGEPGGPQLERWPGGGVAAEGAWIAGARDGVWTSWFADGAFRSQASWRAGVLHGARREIGRDGRIVEIDMVEGTAGGMRSLAAGSPMPEWDGTARVEGDRYRGHTNDGTTNDP